MPSQVYVNFFCNDGDDDDDDDDDDDESYEKSSDQKPTPLQSSLFKRNFFYEQSTMKRLQFDIK